MVRALYTEDNPSVAAIVRSYVEHFAPDWKLEIVGTGKDCLERMAEGGWDILLLDLVLPDTDGLKILGELARRNDSTPVVMVTGHGQTELAVRALRAGAADCVDKTSPQFLQLVDIVKRVQARHAELRASRPAAGRSARQHKVLLIEGSATTGRSLRDFFEQSAPHYELSLAATSAEMDREFASGLSADAVIIGPHPPGTKPLEVLRRVHSQSAQTPVLLVSDRDESETAIAAFKLGAQDYILQNHDYTTELVFSLNNALRRVSIEQENVRLTRELETLNRNLEAQVAARTAELRALSSRLLRIQEEERRAIARELHDEIGQLLTGLRMQLDAAAKNAAGTPLQEVLMEAKTTADNLLGQARSLTQRYRPRVLDDLGLQPALETHGQQFAKQTGITVALDIAMPPERLPGELETVVYRFAQEALTNVARHSGAKTATLTVTHDGQRLIVEVIDRGKGFDTTAALARTDSLGLAGMRERVALAGGEFALHSRLGQGTRVQAEFPLPIPTKDSAP